MKLNYHSKSFLMALMIITSILFSFGCNPEPKKVEVLKNYTTGEISRRYYTIDGKKEGLMTDYHRDGSLKGERWFENDVQVGKTTLYYPSGRIREVQYYQNGKIHGGDTTFYEDGSPEFVVTFNEGVKDGYVRKWNTEDSLIYEARFSLDKLVEVKGEVIRPDSIPNK